MIRKGIPQDLLYWIRHCEGGKTTQRIQDLLLLIRSYGYLIDTYNISSIVILSHPQAEWEDKVLTMIGQRRGIEVSNPGTLPSQHDKGKVGSLGKVTCQRALLYFLYPSCQDAQVLKAWSATNSRQKK